MADKEATVYIVDVGKSTAQKHGGRSQTNLEWALTYVWDRMTGVIALERKTTLQAVVAVRTNVTRNELSDDPGYQNIAVLQDLKALSLQEFRDLQGNIASSTINDGDAISAIVVAIQLIARTCKRLKYIRRIVLVTSSEGAWSGDDAEEIARKISEDQIQLTVVDVGAEARSAKQENQAVRTENQKLMHQLAKASEGTYLSLADAIEEMSIPKLKATRPVPSFKGKLCLGDPGQYDDAMMIDIERYPRTMIRRPQTASTFVESLNAQPGDSTQTSGTLHNSAMDVDIDQMNNALGMVRGSRTYEVADETQESGKKTIALEDLAKGFEYGRTAVPVGESDMPLLKLEASSAFEIVGFIPTENYEQYMGLSRSNVVIAQRANTKAAMALSSFIHALVDVNSVAVARLVAKDDKPPVLLLLAPVIEESGLEYLIDIELPFAEDVRSYRFPPLDHVFTVSGKVLKEHRNIPNAQLTSAMSDFVDGLDIDASSSKDSWNPADYASLNDSFSPALHHIDAAVRYRAIHPDANPPEAAAILTKYSGPPADLVPGGALKKLQEASDIKKVPPKAQTRHFREAVKPLSGLDVAALIAKGKKGAAPKVERDNPIPTFKQMLETTTDPNGIHEAAKQLGAIIEEQVHSSAGDQRYAQVLEELDVLRSELADLEEPGLWNEWARAFKLKVLDGKLGGDRRELWWQIRGQGLGLVGGGRTNLEQDEIDAFMRMKL